MPVIINSSPVYAAPVADVLALRGLALFDQVVPAFVLYAWVSPRLVGTTISFSPVAPLKFMLSVRYRSFQDFVALPKS